MRMLDKTYKPLVDYVINRKDNDLLEPILEDAIHQKSGKLATIKHDLSVTSGYKMDNFLSAVVDIYYNDYEVV